MSIIQQFSSNYIPLQSEKYTLEEYFELCKKDPLAYATAVERMVAAIGEPRIVDTSRDPRLSRIFQNRTIKMYDSFSDFYGMETVIEDIVRYYKNAARGLEESKQILYLLGPVGSGKSQLSEQLKRLMETYPIYALAYDGVVSPIYESPLGLFDRRYGEQFEEQFGIDRRYLTGIASDWAMKRLNEDKGNLEKFSVVKVHPSRFQRIGIAKTEPGDDNNQDISALVGKIDLRMLDRFSQSDPDAYSYSGALNRATQGLFEFVEMFKAPIKVLHPLLTATQERNYMGNADNTLPFNGTILAHSNQSEWQKFRNNKNNEAFIDRVCVIKVPYCLRKDEEAKIYKKLLSESKLENPSVAPQTLEILAEFAVASRLKEHENSTIPSKVKVYNGENVKNTDPKAKSIQEYRDVAGVDEGMTGISTRFAHKVLSDTLDYDPEEIAADPVHLMLVLERHVVQSEFDDKSKETDLLDYIKSTISPNYAEFIGKEIQTAYIEHADEYGQSMFDRYIEYADNWIENKDFKDPDTGILLDRNQLDNELEKTEKPAGIANPKDFRNEVVQFVLRARSKNGGKNPKWSSYEKLREVIEKRMFSSMEEMLPIISFDSKKSKDAEEKHASFIARMEERGYTRRQTRRLVDWFIRVKNAG